MFKTVSTATQTLEIIANRSATADDNKQTRRFLGPLSLSLSLLPSVL